MNTKHWIAKVNRGVALLNAKYPHWYLNFTPSSIAHLNVNDPNACVLHGVTGDEFLVAYNALTGRNPIFASLEGFHVESSNSADVDFVNRLWRKVITTSIEIYTAKVGSGHPFFFNKHNNATMLT